MTIRIHHKGEVIESTEENWQADADTMLARPAPVRRDAEAAIGKWLVSREPVAYAGV